MVLCLNSSLHFGNALKCAYREGVPEGGGFYKSGAETKLGNGMYQLLILQKQLLNNSSNLTGLDSKA